VKFKSRKKYSKTVKKVKKELYNA
jgi:hypothetical protein